MINEKQLDSKIFTGIIALCSSFLTNALTDFTSISRYIITVSNNKLTLISASASFSKLILNIIHIILIYFIIFIFLIFFTKLLVKIYKKIRTRKIKVKNEQDLIHIMYSIKQDSMKLYEKFSLNASSLIQESFVKLNIKELNSIILQLNNCFSHPNRSEFQKIKKIFRKNTSSSYISSITGLSYYELEGLFDLLQFMLNKAITVSTYDPLLKSDCKNMIKLIEDLKSSLTII